MWYSDDHSKIIWCHGRSWLKNVQNHKRSREAEEKQIKVENGDITAEVEPGDDLAIVQRIEILSNSIKLRRSLHVDEEQSQQTLRWTWVTGDRSWKQRWNHWVPESRESESQKRFGWALRH